MTVRLGETVLASGQAGPSGRFSMPLQLPDLDVGRYEITAHCGPVLTQSLDVVLTTGGAPGGSSLAVFAFFVLLGYGVLRAGEAP